MKSKQKIINYDFKILYFFGIIFIVMGHCGNGGIDILTNWFPFYSFHLGLFVFCSGYFFREKNERCIFLIKNKFLHLVLPMYCWNVLYGLLVVFLSLKGFSLGSEFTIHNLLIEPLKTGHQFVFNLGTWFVYPLFFVETIHIILTAYSKKIFKFKNVDYAIYSLYFVLGIFCIYLSQTNFNVGWGLVLLRIMYFLPFYAFGLIYKKIEKYDTWSNAKYFVFLITIQLIIISLYGSAPAYIPSWCTFNTDNYLLPYIIGVTGIAFWLRISKIMSPLLRNNKMVMHIANNTYAIMTHHLLGFFIVNTCYALFHKFTMGGVFQDFNWDEYLVNIFYIYTPWGTNQWLIVYVIAGIFISLGLQYIENLIRKIIMRK